MCLLQLGFHDSLQQLTAVLHTYMRNANNDCRHRLTFDECLQLLVLDLATLHVNLEGQQHREHELVHLIQATSRIAKHFKRQVFNDVLDAFQSDW